MKTASIHMPKASRVCSATHAQISNIPATSHPHDAGFLLLDRYLYPMLGQQRLSSGDVSRFLPGSGLLY